MAMSNDRSGREWDKFEDTSGGPAIRIADPAGTGALRQVEKMNFDGANQLRVVFTQPALIAGTSNIGVVGTFQKLLVNPATETTTNLAKDAIYTSTSRDLQVGTSAPYYAYGGYSILTISDKAGAVFIEESQDGTNWHCVFTALSVEYTAADGTTKTQVASIDYRPTTRYVRFKYQNKGADTTTKLLIVSRVMGRM